MVLLFASHQVIGLDVMLVDDAKDGVPRSMVCLAGHEGQRDWSEQVRQPGWDLRRLDLSRSSAPLPINAIRRGPAVPQKKLQNLGRGAVYW